MRGRVGRRRLYVCDIVESANNAAKFGRGCESASSNASCVIFLFFISLLHASNMRDTLGELPLISCERWDRALAKIEQRLSL